MIMEKWASLFIKRSYNTFLVTFIMFKHDKVGKYIECMRQKLSKYKLIVKFHPGMKGLLIFFFFFSSWDEISSVFLKGMSSLWDEISSQR